MQDLEVICANALFVSMFTLFNACIFNLVFVCFAPMCIHFYQKAAWETRYLVVVALVKLKIGFLLIARIYGSNCMMLAGIMQCMTVYNLISTESHCRS